ncbi:hypothetical protein HO133_005641 [Letharia lupina]|uniref:Methyltransferase domain-containing protein n=1 Tax=Letharia lupina TaxID=560253 RepID=A0A8H6C7A6_9LECA|nr:uncharacterized protein HO133_005641 [Letharia lupina]KAF6218295.1 hypothetical protein HO133_005641 [Letharia lupina]
MDKKMSGISKPDTDIPKLSGESKHTEALAIAPETVQLVWNYSKMSVTEIPDHWMDVSPVYKKMKARMLKGEKLLELGCGFGQNMRKLCVKGVAAEDLFGFYTDRILIEAGYDLFVDRSTQMTFFTGDIVAGTFEFERFHDKFNIVFASMFFHLFDWTEQVAIAKQVVNFLRKQPGSMIFGQQIGHIKPGLYQVGRESAGYAHNTATLQQMWDFVGSETKSTWHVQGIMEVNENIAALTQDDNTRCLRFWIRRLWK